MKKRYVGNALMRWIYITVFSLILAIGINNFLVTVTTVVGSSMNPTLNSGDKLVINKTKRTYEKGDMIVFLAWGETMLVKRIIATPDDHLVITNGKLYINDVEIIEDYILNSMAAAEANEVDFTLSTDEFFVMGDNRLNSIDSRSFGPIHNRNIVGSLLFTF